MFMWLCVLLTAVYTMTFDRTDSKRADSKVVSAGPDSSRVPAVCELIKTSCEMFLDLGVDRLKLGCSSELYKTCMD